MLDMMPILRQGDDELAVLAVDMESTIEYILECEDEMGTEQFEKNLTAINIRLQILADKERNRRTQYLIKTLNSLEGVIAYIPREDRKRMCSECKELAKKLGLSEDFLRGTNNGNWPTTNGFIKIFAKQIKTKQNCYEDEGIAEVEHWLRNIPYNYLCIIYVTEFVVQVNEKY